MNKWTKIGIVLGLLTISFWNPALRTMLLFLLPLGSGIDDLIFIGAAILAAIILGGRWLLGTEHNRPDKTRLVFIAVLGVAVLVVLLGWILAPIKY